MLFVLLENEKVLHLLMINDYNLDGHHRQHISGSPQLSVGSRTDNQALLDHGRIALRHQKFNDWFFRQFDLDILNADGQHYRRSTIIVNNLNQAIKIFFQLNTSSEGANIISSPFYPREGTRCAEKVFGGSRHKIWEQHKQHWNQASPERIRYGHQDTVKALNRGLKGNDNKSYIEIKTKGKLQNPKRLSESRLVRRYSSTEAAQRINKLRYVEVENCRINRKLVSSLPNSTHQNFIKDISERGECWIISSILISHLRYKVVPGM